MEHEVENRGDCSHCNCFVTDLEKPLNEPVASGKIESGWVKFPHAFYLSQVIIVVLMGLVMLFVSLLVPHMGLRMILVPCVIVEFGVAFSIARETKLMKNTDLRTVRLAVHEVVEIFDRILEEGALSFVKLSRRGELPRSFMTYFAEVYEIPKNGIRITVSSVQIFNHVGKTATIHIGPVADSNKDFIKEMETCLDTGLREAMQTSNP